MTSAPTVTTLLRDWRSGDPGALDQLMPLIYNDLRRIAGSYMRSERPGHTLQATALVNESFARLAGGPINFLSHCPGGKSLPSRGGSIWTCEGIKSGQTRNMRT